MTLILFKELTILNKYYYTFFKSNTVPYLGYNFLYEFVINFALPKSIFIFIRYRTESVCKFVMNNAELINSLPKIKTSDRDAYISAPIYGTFGN